MSSKNSNDSKDEAIALIKVICICGAFLLTAKACIESKEQKQKSLYLNSPLLNPSSDCGTFPKAKKEDSNYVKYNF